MQALRSTRAARILASNTFRLGTHFGGNGCFGGDVRWMQAADWNAQANGLSVEVH
jgi:hypothetical protein